MTFVRRDACLALLLAVAGCVTSPEPIYYALAPTAGSTQTAEPRKIKLRRPVLPGYLDRNEIVRSVIDYRLRVSSRDSWGEPLGDMLGRVLAQDLEARLPGSVVFVEGSALSGDPDAVVAVDVRRFDVGADGRLSLIADIGVANDPQKGAERARSVILTDDGSGATTAGLVGAMSRLVGKLADVMAGALQRT